MTIPANATFCDCLGEHYKFCKYYQSPKAQNKTTIVIDGREYRLCIFAFAPSKATGTHFAQLDDGRITEYTHAWGLETFTPEIIETLISRQEETTPDLQVLGQGIIWRIDDILQGTPRKQVE